MPEKDCVVMAIEDHPAFPKFNYVALGLRESEQRMFDAMSSGDENRIAAAKLELTAALDAYKKVLDEIDFAED
jgi:hypothetical protein